jgi:hypothetical protein
VANWFQFSEEKLVQLLEQAQTWNQKKEFEIYTCMFFILKRNMIAAIICQHIPFCWNF